MSLQFLCFNLGNTPYLAWSRGCLVTWIAVGFSLTSVTTMVNVFSSVIGGLPLSVLLTTSENLGHNKKQN